ncbi:Golgi-associated plant pathogenesis-related protein 1 [Orchesella cincta]|uniref:Golgi-associated plant pathogenesis-related protein 1 n=1 Tax=Orchesella cincta TaxID=48709 RepID=A0A1D2MDN7_ORCCI|nr:Golgi-associated plant pathogenesis-related protein 1 [Orchesella cincta]
MPLLAGVLRLSSKRRFYCLRSNVSKRTLLLAGVRTLNRGCFYSLGLNAGARNVYCAGDNAEREDAFTGWGSNSEDVESAEGPSTGLLKVALTEHNKFRRRHGVPDLKPDQKLNAIAQKYANYLASNNLFQHSKTDYENLAGAPGKTKEDAIRYAVKKWYDEEKIYRKVYKYKNGAFSLKTGHFTAMIWRKTTNLGIGVAYNKAKKWWVVVANYSPRGNTKGQFEGNVPPPKG